MLFLFFIRISSKDFTVSWKCIRKLLKENVTFKKEEKVNEENDCLPDFLQRIIL